jgi:putative transcriptional regulator
MDSEKVLISNTIRKLRFFASEMTQQELADKTGVTRQTIVAIENGKYFPSLELAFRIAHVFNVQLSDVFTYNLEYDSVLKKVKTKQTKTSYFLDRQQHR